MFIRVATLGLGALSCTQYAIRNEDRLRDGSVFVLIDEPIDLVSRQLRSYLGSRRRFEQHLPTPVNDAEKHVFLQPWIRDSSLRYHLLLDDTRIRHLSEWKAQWTLTAMGKKSTKITLTVMEVIFLGPPSHAGERPDEKTILLKTAASEWFETPADSTRSILELRRFWIENYAAKSLPPRLANFSAPSLLGPPLSKEMNAPQTSKKPSFHRDTRSF